MKLTPYIVLVTPGKPGVLRETVTQNIALICRRTYYLVMSVLKLTNIYLSLTPEF